ncbi:MAG TPA: hypothetical protein VK599_08025, partial [Streptosporangiaceae bacterium]|nr:hypothetical protein [Streptosporangiaceae bacterium]
MPKYPFQPLIDLAEPGTMRERARACGTANAGGWFWLPCPLCGLEFGGHETMQGTPEKPASVHQVDDPPGI